MADPLSIAASIAGLVTLADVVFDRLRKYIKAAKNATKETEDLAQEINLLGGALNSLSRLARSLDNEPLGRKFRMYHIEGCNDILSEIDRKLKKLDGNSAKKKMMWPFSSARIREMLEDLAKHKQSITLALSANSMDLLLRQLGRDEDLHKTASEIKADVKKTREIASRIQRDAEREKVLDFFLRYDPQQNYEMSLKLRHPRTGTWLLRLPSFQTWLSTTDEKLWLSGIPGAGKTVLAGTIIEAALAKCNQKIAGAFFFCDYKNSRTQSPENILGALAYQIAIQKEEAYVILEQYYLDLHPQRGLARNLTANGLLGVLGKMIELFDHVFLVIDGIDECGELAPDVLDSLCDASVDSENISIALLSRDEHYIRDRLENGFVCERVAAHTEDVEEYVTAEIEERIRKKRLYIEDPALKGEVMHGLIDGAKGMFRWVSCQLDHLCECVSDEECRTSLKELPPTLNETYLRILHRIPHNKASLVQVALHFIAFAEPRLTIEQLREIISVPKHGDRLSLVHENAIKKRCSSLIRKSNDGLHFEFAHFSVQEFLCNANLLEGHLELFLITKARFTRLIVIQCLDYLQLANFNHFPSATIDEITHMEKRQTEYPLYSYASYHWPIYAELHYNDNEIIHCIETFFGNKKNATFTSWSVQLVVCCISDGKEKPHNEKVFEAISGLIHEDFTPFHMACLLPFPRLCSYLLDRGADIEQESPFGTPLQCATGKIAIFQTDIDYMFLDSEETVKCLLEAGARLQISDNQALLKSAADAFGFTGRIGIITLLLRGGLPIEEGDIEKFSNIFMSWDDVEASDDEFEQFIETLLLMSDHSHLYRELYCLACEFAITQCFHFTTASNFLNSSIISVTHDGWKRQIAAAARIGDVDAFMASKSLAPCPPSTMMIHGKRLLHIALEHVSYTWQLDNMIPMIQTLIEAGCSFLHPDSEGRLPIHCWSSQVDAEPRWPVKVFFDHGMITSSQDIKGQNLLHSSVASYGLLSSFIEHDSEENITASLCMVDQEGYTPLSRALKEQQQASSSLLFERGRNYPKTWQSPISSLLLATKANCEEVFKGLLAAGVTVEDEVLTPLHYVGVKTSINFINYLKSLYPGACGVRANGKIPLDIYIEQLCTSSTSHSFCAETFSALFPFQLHNFERGLVWEHFARNLSQNYSKGIITKVIKELIRLGCLASYETASRIPGLILLLEQFGNNFQNLGQLCPLVTEDFSSILNSTSQWLGFQTNPLIIRFLKAAILSNEVDLVRILVEKGVPVYWRVEDESALESSCKCNDVKLDTFQLILEFADKEHLDEINATGDGLGLIHLLTKGSGGKAIELIRRGANPNLRAGKFPNSPALMHHLKIRQEDIALTLLELGADPTISDKSGFDACLMAARLDIPNFLFRVLDMETTTWQLDWQLDWQQYCSANLKIRDTFFALSGMNSLHIASGSGSVGCLKFYIDHNFLCDVNKACDQMYTPLHIAALMGRIHVIQYLHGLGANINARTAEGYTPLHLAVLNAQCSAVEELLDLGSHTMMDKWGMSPYMYACQSGKQSIIDCFEDILQDNVQDINSPNHHAISPIDKKMGLLITLRVAIARGDIRLCQRLRKRGCELDIDIPSIRGCSCSPLLFAIHRNKPDIIWWLLKNGVSTLKPLSPVCGVGHSVHEILKRRELIHLLPQFLESYMTQGGSLLEEPHNLAAAAIANFNNSGLHILFKHLKQNKIHYAGMLGKDPNEAAKMLADQRWGTSETVGTPVHVAVSKGNLEAAEFLLENGADANLPNCRFRPALHFAVDSEPRNAPKLISLLITHGARLECPDDQGLTPLAYASYQGRWDSAQALLDAGADPETLNHRLQNVLYLSASGRSSGHKNSFAHFLALGVNPHYMDSYGISPMQQAMFEIGSCEYPLAVVFLNGNYGVQNTGPYPWHLLTDMQYTAWLTIKFKLFHKRIPLNDLYWIANTEPSGCQSPLCLAASQEVSMAIENLLTLGADLEFEGCPEGTALMGACSAGRLQSVVTLVRRGAVLSYHGVNGFRTAINKTKTPPHILRWLLVDRFTDQAKIAEVPDEGSAADALNIRPWSGVAKAELIISEKLERRSDQSSKDYWIYLMDQKRQWRGKVVPSMGKRKTIRRSNLIPVERVRIHPDGYETPVAEKSSNSE